MELKAGYKQTDLGIFPDEWAIEPLGRHAGFRTGPFGSALHKSDYTSDGVPIVNPMHIVGGKIEPTRTMTLTEEAARKLSDFQLKAGEIVIARRGDMGRCAVVQEEHDGWICGTGSMIIRPYNADPTFLQRVLSSRRAIAAIKDASVGTTMVNLNQATLSGLAIQFPPLPEQRAIATASSDVNALLGGLDRLIAKKRELRQAALQQLLTGRTRLPGFSGEWDVKRLGDCVTFLRHGVNSRSELVPEGRVKYLHYGEVHACKDVYLSPVSLPCLPVAKATLLDRLRDGDLVFADASEDVAGVSKSVEIRNVGNTELVAGLHTITARFDRSILANGFKGFLQYCPQFSTHLRRLAAGTKVYATNRAHVASVEMRLPSVAEQAAIAAVLSDMDAEIASLEARREKTRDIERAMMHELLTGATRLPLSQVPDA